MRIVFVGTSELTRRTAQLLLDSDHDVVIIEPDRQVIADLQPTMDCGFLQGDGSKPAVMREAGPKQTDLLFCLTDDDHTNMIASLVGRSLGFPRVVTRIEDPELETICQELGLQDTIIPSLTISRYLADMAQGLNILELSTAIKNEARFFAFLVEDESVHRVSDLNLPPDAKVVCLYREGEFQLADEESKLRKKDEVVILTHSRNLSALRTLGAVALKETLKPKAHNRSMNKLRFFLVVIIFALNASTAGGDDILRKREILDGQAFWDNRDWDWYVENIPFFECPDAEITTTYYYRWELLTKHLTYGSPNSGYSFTEFIDRPFWSGAYGAISCPAGHQLYEARWLRQPRIARLFTLLVSYARSSATQLQHLAGGFGMGRLRSARRCRICQGLAGRLGEELRSLGATAVCPGSGAVLADRS